MGVHPGTGLVYSTLIPTIHKRIKIINFGVGQRCFIDSQFNRHCSEYTVVEYDITANECLSTCISESNCMVAQHYPGNQIWNGDQRPVCWMMDDSAVPCPSATTHNGATMIYCGIFRFYYIGKYYNQKL